MGEHDNATIYKCRNKFIVLPLLSRGPAIRERVFKSTETSDILNVEENPVNQPNLSMQPRPNVQNDEIWCPQCRRYTKFLRVMKAAKIADVDRRTVYRYAESGSVYSVKIVGKTIRVCSGCLLK